MDRIGKYLVKESIASGGMAEIYRGYLEGPHGFVKDVVIKAIHPHLLKDERYIKLFLREAKLWARLNHSSIVQVYELFEEKNRYYLVMEYVKGTDLLNVIRQAETLQRPIGIPRTIKIFESVLSALDYAHKFKDDSENIFGIVHRDISPQNILISVYGDVKITDFGIAKASLSTGLTSEGALIGKVDYMSPEQALGMDVDLRTDIFSTGVVLWETLTGNKLFDGNNNIELLEKVRRCEIIRPSSINPEVDEKLEGIVMKSLQKDRRLRYNDATEFLNDLKEYLREYPHRIEEEDIAGFMRELFPEYVKDYTYETELLEDSKVERDDRRGRVFLLIPIFFLFLAMIILSIWLYPKKVEFIEPIRDSNDAHIKIEDAYYTEVGPIDVASLVVDNLDFGLSVGIHEPKEMVRKDMKMGYEQSVEVKQREPSEKSAVVIKKGRLSINAIPWADVYIGKKKIGTTPIFDYEVRAGLIELIFRNDDLGIVRKRRLLIEAGRETKHTEDLTKN
ncbi:MAG: serine/threonine protein kinase [Deltaproteobacteria bacterium]|nr:serine/threonine protein kinase [Deltaproteobacteria bacterium]